MRDRIIVIGCVALLVTSVLVGFFQAPLEGPGSYWSRLLAKENVLYNLALLCFSVAAVLLARWVALRIRRHYSKSQED